MLRITKMSDNDHLVYLKVEGRVVGDWVDELDRACGSCLSQKKKVILDVSDVTYIDRRGVDVLKGLLTERVAAVRGASLLVQTLLGREPDGKS